jgi:hypothetical protein
MTYEQNDVSPETLDVQDELLKDPDYLKTKNKIQVLLMKRYLSRDVNLDRPKFEVEIEWADKYSRKLREVFNIRFCVDKKSILDSLSSTDGTQSLLSNLEEEINWEERFAA